MYHDRKYQNYLSVEIDILKLFNTKYRVRDMVLKATFNNISVISRWLGLLVENTGVPGENRRPIARNW